MPKVSVIIASYNHENYIRKTIQSILNQSFQDFELIITDDGSTDNTVDEIKKIKDPRIKLFTFKNNLSAPIATTNCLKVATGTYISPINSDDVMMPDKLEKQVKFLDNHKDIGVVFSSAEIIDDNDKVISDENNYYVEVFHQSNRTRYEWLHHFFYRGNCLCYPSSMFRKEVFDYLLPLNYCLRQLIDFDMWIKVCLKYEIYILQENLVRFRSHQNKENVSAATIETSTRSLWEHRIVLENFLKIEDIKQLSRIFPEIKNLFQRKDIDKDLIPFIISQLALTVDSSSFIYQDFALHTIYNILQDETMMHKLKKVYNFSYCDFIKLSGKYDIFRLKELGDLYYHLNKEREKSNALQDSLKTLSTKDISKNISFKIKSIFYKNKK